MMLQLRFFLGRADTMSAEHLGCDAVPANIVGGVTGGHRVFSHHHRHISLRLRHNNALYERNMHKWRSKRRFV